MPTGHRDHDPSRRTALRAGLGALLAAGPLARLGSAGLPASTLLGRLCRRDSLPPTGPSKYSAPIAQLKSLGPTVDIAGVPFAPHWFGDSFDANRLPFHECEDCGDYPEPSESVEVAIVGGGLSGLTCAYQLRDLDTVVFDLRPRMGGQAMGESLGDRSWSMASAYFMAADKGTRFETLYAELELAQTWRQDTEGFSFEYEGDVGTDLLGRDPPRAWVEALANYRTAVKFFGGDDYPEIPFDDEPSDVVVDLDSRTFRADLLQRCGVLPPRLEFLLQAYCYSSFGVGMDELSAAAGWNFVAAEEFGRNVMPAGNAGLAQQLWNRARRGPGSTGMVRMRANSIVGRIDRDAKGPIIRWRTHDGYLRSTRAQHVIMANAKYITRHILRWMEQADPQKWAATFEAPTVPYIVANVLLSRAMDQDFYDLYLGGGRAFPLDGEAFQQHRVFTDAVNAGYATAPSQAALSIYWPLPWHTARFTIVQPNQWMDYANLMVPQLLEKLPLFGLSTADVQQVRMARWGHAMPFAVPGVITSGAPQFLRRPLEGCIWFANQDTWMLPAVETCITEAFWTTDQVRDALGR